MKNLTIASIFICVLAVCVFSQTTAFNYQGHLQSGGSPANGNYDLEFKLFDALTNGTQQGTPQQRLNVLVSNGVFSVSLDFGAVSLPGANRYLDIAVRTTGGGTFTPLTPRQLVNSAPYAVRSLNATNADNATNAANATNATTATNALQLGGVAASQYVLTGDPRLSDPRPPTAGSGNYVQNTTTPQSANFSVIGNGTVGGVLSGGTVNTENGFNFRGGRLLTLGGFAFQNLYLGTSAGSANPGSSRFNSFVGYSSGRLSTIGDGNSFFGAFSGDATTQGEANTFVGSASGLINTTGAFNTFIGRDSGRANVGGNANTIVGTNADVGSPNLQYATAIGSESVVSSSNTITMGRSNGADTVHIPGALNVTGAFSGNGSGLTNLNAGNITTGTLAINRGGTGSTTQNFVDLSTNQTGIGGNKSFAGNIGIGNAAPAEKLDVGNTSVSGNIRLSSPAGGASNIDFYDGDIGGRIQYNHPSDEMSFYTATSARLTIKNDGNVGIGTAAPAKRLHILDNGGNTLIGNPTGCNPGLTGIGFASSLSCTNYSVLGDGTSTLINRPTGGALVFRENNSDQMAIISGGNVGVGTNAPQQRLSVSDGMNIDQNNLNSGTVTNTLRFGAGNSGEALGSKRTVGGNQWGLDFYTASSNRMSITASGNVGIGTNNPLQKLDVSGAGIIRANVNSDSNAGFGLSLNNQMKWSLATTGAGAFQIFNQVNPSNALWIDNTNNNVGISTSTPTATLEVNGYTKLGTDAPSIRMKKLTGTTAAAEGGAVSIPNGLDPLKVLSVSVLVLDANGAWRPPNYTNINGIHFQWYLFNSFITITNIPGGSAQILSKPIKILITYEE